MHFLAKFKFSFQNIHKSVKHLHSLLDSLQTSTDLLFVQEVPFYKIRNIASLDSEDGLPIHGTSHHPAWTCVSKFSSFPSSQVAIFVNRRILQEFAIFMDPLSFPNPNIIDLRLTRIVDNTSATVVCLYNPPSSKNSAIYDLVRAIPQRPDLALIQGDFNLHSPAWDSRVQDHNDLTEELLNVLTQAQLNLLNDPQEPTWFHPKRTSVLDLLFVHSRLLQHNNHTLIVDRPGRGQGDHAIIHFNFDREWTWRSEAYIKPGSDEESAYIATISSAIKEGAAASHLTVERIFDDIYQCFHSAWEKFSRRPKANSNPTMWWTDACQEAKDCLRYDRSRNARNAFKSTIRAAQSEYFRHKLEGMRKPWEGLSWTRNRRPPAYSIIKDGQESVSSMEHLWKVFDQQFNAEAAAEVDWNFINALPTAPERDSPPIGIYEVKQALKSTLNSSAPGEDHITWGLLKGILSDYPTAHALVLLFNRVMDESVWPSALKMAISVVIPKPNKDDYSMPKSYRPIALLNVLGKLLTKVLADRLQFDAAKFNLLHPGQFGGVQRHATTDVGLILTDIIVKARERGMYTSVLALDIAQFFPSLNHEAMVIILRKLGFHSKIANFVKAFFQDRKTRYKWGSALSDPFPNSQGTPQGDCLSPILSALYIALLLKTFAPWGTDKPVNMLSFVDDCIIITSSPSIESNVSLLSAFYPAILAALARFGLQSEHSKLELMHFIAYDIKTRQRTFKESPKLPVTFSHNGTGYVIKAKDQWRYLGFYFDPYLKFDIHVKLYVNKAFSTIRACQMLGNSCGGLRPKQCAQVYRSAVLPILSYGLVLWYTKWGRGVQNKLKRMNRVQAFATRWITGGFKTTPRGAMEVISGIPPLVIWCNLRLSNYTARISALPDNHLLRSIYQEDPVPSSFRSLPQRRRRKNLPDDNPIQRLKTNRIQEFFDLLHDEARPGNCILDKYLERITYWHMDAPQKNTKTFKGWLPKYKTWVLNEVRNGLVFFTDGAFWANTKRGKAAVASCEKGTWLEDRVEWCAAASSYDAELAAFEMAMVCAFNRNDVKSFTIIIDNQAAITGAFDTGLHSNQNISLRICALARGWLERSEDHHIRIAWCPSHVGIEGNERADHLAKTQESDIDIRPDVLREQYVKTEKERMNKWWQRRAKAPSYVGKNWLPLRRKGKVFQPTVSSSKKNFFMDLADGDVGLMSRITRTLTNHAPTGEFRKRFFPDKPSHCHHCGEDIFQSRCHILTTCSKYSHPFSSLRNFLAEKKNADLLVRFLKENPTALTFEDLPPDPP